jgi:hypothetical protein
MPRSIVLWLSFALFLSSITVCSPRTGATNPTIVRIVNPVTGDESFNFTRHDKNIGDTFLVNITIENVTDLSVWQTAMKWNTSILEYVEGTIFLFNEGFMIPENRGHPVYSNGTLYCGAATGPSQPTFSGSAVLAQITLEILAVGQCNLTFENTDTFLLDLNGTDIPFTKLSASFSYSTSLAADVNNDGIVDMKDVMTVIQAFNSYPNTPRWNPACDLNQDNRIDMRDILVVVLDLGRSS